MSDVYIQMGTNIPYAVMALTEQTTTTDVKLFAVKWGIRTNALSRGRIFLFSTRHSQWIDILENSYGGYLLTTTNKRDGDFAVMDVKSFQAQYVNAPEDMDQAESSIIDSHLKAFHQWAEERGILKHTTIYNQFEKIDEEVGEFLKATYVLKDANEVEKEFGDVLNSTIMFYMLIGADPLPVLQGKIPYTEKRTYTALIEVLIAKSLIAQALFKKKPDSAYSDLLDEFLQLTLSLGRHHWPYHIYPIRAMEKSFENFRYRKGKMVDNKFLFEGRREE